MELIDLPVEVHAMIIKKVDLKDLFNLSRVLKYFFMLCNDNTRYERKIVLSRKLVSFDKDLTGLISGELTNLYEGLEEIIKPISNYRAFLFSIMKKKLQSDAYELLPFSIHNHLFCCLRGSRTAGRCRLCTPFFIEDTDQASYLDFNFTVNKDDLKEFVVYSLIQDSVVGRFTFSIYYIVRQ